MLVSASTPHGCRIRAKGREGDRSIDARKAGGYVKHMYTELALVHAPGAAL